MGEAVLSNSVATHVNENDPNRVCGAMSRVAVRATSGMVCQGFFYWVKPFPLKVTVLSAKIYFYTEAMAESVTHTFTFQRLNQSFATSNVTWNNRPTSMISGTKTVSKTGSQPTAQEWELDITDWMQTISLGGKWYGVRALINENLQRNIYSDLWGDTALRPRLEVTWSDAPESPGGMSPGGGRAVGLAKPVLKASYRDYSGSTQLLAMQVQLNATDVWTSPTYDSGSATPALVSVPEFDLNNPPSPAPAYAGLADGATTFWRVRLQDAAGQWSAWSASTSFKRDDKGVLNVINPLYGSPALSDNFEGNAQGWVLDVNCTVAYSTAQFHTGVGSLAVTAAAAGTVTARHDTSATAGVPVVVGRSYAAAAWFRAATVARSVRVDISWHNSGGTFLSTSTGTSVTDTTSGWTSAVITATAPASAAFALVKATVLAAAGAGEIHYVDDVTLADTTTFPVVEDATPPIAWQFTGETQAAYQVQVTHTTSNAIITDWDSGKITSTATSVGIPEGKINEPSSTIYTVTVRVWDNKQREATPGDTPYVEVVRSFTFVPGAAIGTTGLTAVPQDPRPKVVLTWTAATFPDRFNILRNNTVIAAALDPLDTFVSGTTHTYTDESPSPQRSLTYQVQRVINNVASASNTTAVCTVRSTGIWLREPVSGLELFIAGDDDNDFTLGKQSVALKSTAPTANTVLINQSLGGLEIPVAGQLVTAFGRTAQEWRDQYIQMRELRVKRFWLAIGDYQFLVVCDFENYGRRGIPEHVFKVGFMAYQQDSINSILLGS